MKRIFASISILGIVLVMAGTSIAYEIPTHGKMTRRALDFSRFGYYSFDEDLANALFLRGMRGLTAGNQFGMRSENDNSANINSRIIDGSEFEDDFPGDETADDDLRPMNHFFNPQFEPDLISNNHHEAPPVMTTSLRWGLERDINENERLLSTQNHGRPDLVDYFWEGMTSNDLIRRKEVYSQAFRTLGHIVHLVQDLAQPQHVRNDDHCNHGYCEKLFWWDLYLPSVYEPLALNVYNGGQYLPRDTFFDGSAIRLSTLRDYWSEERVRQIGNVGLAMYASTNFVSEGRNFQVDENGDFIRNPFTPLPRGEDGAELFIPDIREIYPELPYLGYRDDSSFGPMETPLPINVFQTPVYDALNGKTEYSHLTSSYSWIGHIANGNNTAANREFIMAPTNHLSAMEHLITRAISYSAGVIDHVFRGRIRISKPSGGIFAIADHSTFNDFDTSRFKKFRTSLRNGTPRIRSDYAQSDEELGAGEMYAVITYRRNYCYTPDLQGELNYGGFRQNGCDQSDYGEYGFEMDTSKPIPISGLSRTSWKEFVFEFPKGVPIDAKNVYLAVYFRGQLGEDEDAIAIGGYDLSEPSFFTIMNHSDYIFLDGQFVTEETATTEEYYRDMLDPNGDGIIDYDISPDVMEIKSLEFTFGVNVLESPVEIPASGRATFAYLGETAEQSRVFIENKFSRDLEFKKNQHLYTDYMGHTHRSDPWGWYPFSVIRGQSGYATLHKVKGLDSPTIEDIYGLPDLTNPDAQEINFRSIDAF